MRSFKQHKGLPVGSPLPLRQGSHTVGQPSTTWKEDIRPDEGVRYAQFARDFDEMQQRMSTKYGSGRALHRKQLLALRARFQVLPGLPEHARHGLFATPGMYDALVRLSNGSMDHVSDREPDIRGFAFKVQGVRGPCALGSGECDSQDFLLINQPAFAFAKSDEFVALVMAASRGKGALLKHLFAAYGLAGGLRMIARFGALMARPFSGFATERFHSAVPIACGPYAVRVRLLPPASQKAEASAKSDWAADMRRRVAGEALEYELQLQFFTDESTTPIEDASVDWPEAAAPYVTVGRLTIPVQNLDGEAARQLQHEAEASLFDPWGGLMAHRPLGDVMRARKVAYYHSQRNRQAA